MELHLFEQITDLLHALTPEELGALQVKTHRRGVKVWFDTTDAPRDHYEAQVLARRHVDGTEGMALEIGFHSEHRDSDTNEQILSALLAGEKRWRKALGAEAESGTFYGADNWRRISEAWIEPDLDDPELAFEVASRLVDYVAALEPLRAKV